MSADGALSGSLTITHPYTGESESATLTGSWAKSGDVYTLTTRKDEEAVDQVSTTTIDGRTLTLKSDDLSHAITVIFQRQD